MTEWKVERVSLWLEKNSAIPLLATPQCPHKLTCHPHDTENCTRREYHFRCWHDTRLPVLICTCINFLYVHVDVKVGLLTTSCWLACLHRTYIIPFMIVCAGGEQITENLAMVQPILCVHSTFYLAK